MAELVETEVVFPKI